MNPFLLCTQAHTHMRDAPGAEERTWRTSELFKILKDDGVKVLYSACQQIWKTQQWPQDWKSQFSSQFQRRAGLKNVQTTRQLHSLPMLLRLCSEFFKLSFSILEWRTSRYTSWVLKRQKNQRSNCQHSLDHRESKWIPEKCLLLFHWLRESLWLGGSQETVENS